jgi:hypothetical protein
LIREVPGEAHTAFPRSLAQSEARVMHNLVQFCPNIPHPRNYFHLPHQGQTRRHLYVHLLPTVRILSGVLDWTLWPTSSQVSFYRWRPCSDEIRGIRGSVGNVAHFGCPLHCKHIHMTPEVERQRQLLGPAVQSRWSKTRAHHLFILSCLWSDMHNTTGEWN